MPQTFQGEMVLGVTGLIAQGIGFMPFSFFLILLYGTFTGSFPISFAIRSECSRLRTCA